MSRRSPARISRAKRSSRTREPGTRGGSIVGPFDGARSTRNGNVWWDRGFGRRIDGCWDAAVGVSTSPVPAGSAWRGRTSDALPLSSLKSRSCSWRTTKVCPRRLPESSGDAPRFSASFAAAQVRGACFEQASAPLSVPPLCTTMLRGIRVEQAMERISFAPSISRARKGVPSLSAPPPNEARARRHGLTHREQCCRACAGDGETELAEGDRAQAGRSPQAAAMPAPPPGAGAPAMAATGWGRASPRARRRLRVHPSRFVVQRNPSLGPTVERAKLRQMSVPGDETRLSPAPRSRTSTFILGGPAERGEVRSRPAPADKSSQTGHRVAGIIGPLKRQPASGRVPALSKTISSRSVVAPRSHAPPGSFPDLVRWDQTSSASTWPNARRAVGPFLSIRARGRPTSASERHLLHRAPSLVCGASGKERPARLRWGIVERP